MTSILYVGMDVHTTSYTLCCYSMEKDLVSSIVKVEPDYHNILKYMDRLREKNGDCQFVCGYEAGCLGYSLYRQLTDHGVNCVILAPSTMPMTRKKEIKTDKRDAVNIAKCLAHGTYSPVYVPSEQDNAVKEYIRMRDDHKETLKRTKQQILSFCARHGKIYSEGSYWTLKHLAWLRGQEFGEAVLQETFEEYLVLYDQACDKAEKFDKRIEEMAGWEVYAQRVQMLVCLIGVKALTALAIIVETGDFARFAHASNYASYPGLVPGEESSGNTTRRTGITKAGNTHVRRLIVEAAQSYGQGAVGKKSKGLKQRQAGAEPNVVAYADKANERLRRKFYRITFHSKRNIAVVAVARELSCFIWGMMTGNIA